MFLRIAFIGYLFTFNMVITKDNETSDLFKTCTSKPKNIMIKRDIEQKIIESAQKMPVIGIIGPRQSGKTTLAQQIFKKHIYISLEDFKAREFALEDPYAFFALYKDEAGIILDEIQEAPDLLSYVQVYSDKYKKPGYFIITGSQNFLVLDAINQTLAGRIALFTLLPLSLSELRNAQLLPESADEAVFKGQYPRVYAEKLDAMEWYTNYIRTYVERDIRIMRNITDFNIFQKFIILCAQRIGQLLNVESLAKDCGITVVTAKAWLNILEASYVLFLLQPYHANVGKRLVKTPKLYFYDTGLASALLRIESAEQLLTHYLRGGLFENMIIVELYKQRYNLGRMPNFYFWRDKTGNEIDCIMTVADKLVPIEIKASMSFSQSYFEGLEYLYNLIEGQEKNGYVVYAGDELQPRTLGTALSWKNVDKIVKK